MEKFINFISIVLGCVIGLYLAIGGLSFMFSFGQNKDIEIIADGQKIFTGKMYKTYIQSIGEQSLITIYDNRAQTKVNKKITAKEVKVINK